VEPREAHVAGQHHGQHELVHGHGLGVALHSQGFFNQLPEANGNSGFVVEVAPADALSPLKSRKRQFLQHGGNR
jgi:hypothetical protein